MVVRKALQMCRDMSIPIVGVVENMSYLVLPDSGKRLDVFGKSKADDMARAAGAPLLAQLPLDPDLARMCDEGELELYSSSLVTNLGQAFVSAVAERGRRAPPAAKPEAKGK